MNSDKPKRIRKSTDSYLITSNEWLQLFQEIEKSNLSTVAKKYSIRRQTLAKKYHYWENSGLLEEASETRGKWNRIFSNEEETRIVIEILNNYVNNHHGGRVCDKLIKETASKAFLHVSERRKVKEFRLSSGWLHDFRYRHDVIEEMNNGRYYKWSIVKPSQHNEEQQMSCNSTS